MATATNASLLQSIVFKAQRGHRHWIYWEDSNGKKRAERASCDMVDMAHAESRDGTFYWVEANTGTIHKMTGSMGQNAKANGMFRD